MPKKIILPILCLTFAFIISGCANKNATPTNTATNNQTSNTSSAPYWQEQGVAMAGAFADAEVVDLGNGQYRLYYSAEPETPGFEGQLYSATSTDGVTWTKEDGVRKTWAIFADVIKLADGRYRMYFQNNQVIKSAVSSDGLTWTDEDGVRVDQNEPGYNLVNVGATSTTRLADGTYIMVYRGTINEKYATTEQIPNSDTQLYFWATSADGLAFTKKGLAIDSRSETLYGLTDGAEWVAWDNNELRVYFWSYTGIYHTVYNNGVFAAPVFDWTNSTDARLKFAPNPPGDPTLVKIGGQWFMYYGQHTQGIYYATLK